MGDESSTADATDDETGMPVIDEDDEEIGVVADAGEDAVTVEPADDVPDGTRSALGWQEVDGPQELPRSSLERLSHGEVEAYVEAFRVHPAETDGGDR